MIAAALLLPILLASCSSTGEEEPTSPSSEVETEAPSADASQPDVAGSAGPANGSASFQMADESFEFSLTTCLISGEDVLAQGPRSNGQDGEIAFLDVDLTRYDGEFSGGVHLELGTDRPFTSSDDVYILESSYNDEGFDVTTSSGTAVVEGMFVAYGQTAFEPGAANKGTLTVNCAAP